MATSVDHRELLALPNEIYQARIAILRAEQQFRTADRHYDDLRTYRYLAACGAGDGHFKAQNTASAAHDVIQARNARDEAEMAVKYTQAEATRRRHQLSVLLAILRAADAPADETADWVHDADTRGT
jgi:hypothetical protein